MGFRTRCNTINSIYHFDWENRKQILTRYGLLKWIIASESYTYRINSMGWIYIRVIIFINCPYYALPRRRRDPVNNFLRPQPRDWYMKKYDSVVSHKLNTLYICGCAGWTRFENLIRPRAIVTEAIGLPAAIGLVCRFTLRSLLIQYLPVALNISVTQWCIRLFIGHCLWITAPIRNLLTFKIPGSYRRNAHGEIFEPSS